MAASPQMPGPPPGAGLPSGAPPMSAAPTSPVAASPASPQSSPQIEQGARIVIDTVRGLRQLSQMFPGTAPTISKINDLIRDLQAKILENAQPPEPAAPPVAG